jgi:hypothetical protein
MANAHTPEVGLILSTINVGFEVLYRSLGQYSSLADSDHGVYLVYFEVLYGDRLLKLCTVSRLIVCGIDCILTNGS